MDEEPRPGAYDQETGLASRSTFLLLVDHAMRRLQRSALTVAVLATGLSGSGVARAPHEGQADTDEDDADAASLAAQVAARLRTGTRAGDVAARLDETHFALLCEDLTSYDQAVVVAERVIDQLDRPYPTPDGEVRLHPDLGVAFPLGDGEPADALVERSLEAMRAAQANPNRRFDVILGTVARSRGESPETRRTEPGAAPPR